MQKSGLGRLGETETLKTQFPLWEKKHKAASIYYIPASGFPEPAEG